MTTSGWIFITIFWGIIIAITSFSIYKVLKDNGNYDNNEEQD